ncbi:hypothetical protein NM688_g7792 [Phlebia brevispora]|uniref:Uncharacterized protein n=1 Tax=Phlebia brevispora TaxID=194682 RepID=A0ACC1S161_9APHY|nr:hypothetical protein NM688_g7792 [Phlebia brevispora]
MIYDIPVNGQLARVNWVGELATKETLPLGTPVTILPEEWESFSNVMKVEKKRVAGTDPIRTMSVYSAASEHQDRGLLRMWGFVKDRNLEPTGTWNKRLDGAARAVQFVKLEGRTCTTAFEPQCIAVDNLREYVSAVLGGGRVTACRNEVHIQHRVFRKAQGAEKTHEHHYTNGEDPTGHAAGVSRQWQLAVRPRFQRWDHNDAQAINTSAIAIRPGDFIQVLVAAEIEYRQTGRGEPNYTKVNLDLVEATRLYSEDQLKLMQIPVLMSQQAAMEDTARQTEARLTMPLITLDGAMRQLALIKVLRACDLVRFLKAAFHEQVEQSKGWDATMLVGLGLVSLEGRTTAIRLWSERLKRFLGKYVSDPEALRRVMDETRTVLSGGGAVHFLQPSSDWTPRDLDFYCPEDQYEIFCIYIIDVLGGVVQLHQEEADMATDIHEPYRHIAIKERRVIQTRFATFDVMCAKGMTSLFPIAHFFATHLMNFVSASSVCIAYPHALAQKVGVYVDGDLTAAETMAVTKKKENPPIPNASFAVTNYVSSETSTA